MNTDFKYILLFKVKRVLFNLDQQGRWSKVKKFHFIDGSLIATPCGIKNKTQTTVGGLRFENICGGWYG